MSTSINFPETSASSAEDIRLLRYGQQLRRDLSHQILTLDPDCTPDQLNARLAKIGASIATPQSALEDIRAAHEGRQKPQRLAPLTAEQLNQGFTNPTPIADYHQGTQQYIAQSQRNSRINIEGL